MIDAFSVGIPAAIQAVLAVISARRKLYRPRQLPLFFLYTVYSVVAAVSRPLAGRNAAIYFRFYWTTEAIYKVLALLVIWEVFQRAFAQEYEDPRFRLVLPGIVVFVAAICLWEAIRHPLARPVPLPESIIYWSDLGVHGVEAIICALYLTLRRPLTAPENRYEFGILVGFGISASVSLIAFLALFEFGAKSVNFFRYGPPLGYLAATIIWLAAFRKPPKPQPKLGPKTWRNLANHVSRADDDAATDSEKRLAVLPNAYVLKSH